MCPYRRHHGLALAAVGWMRTVPVGSIREPTRTKSISGFAGEFRCPVQILSLSGGRPIL